MTDRTVTRTLLFADVRDSVTLYEQRGDSEASRLILALIDDFKQAIKGHRGEVVKVTGDGVMAVFDQPDRGVLAASEMIAQAAQQQVGVGIGLDHGPTVTRSQDYFGTTVNIAARIMALAHAGEILMTEAVVEHLSPVTRKLTRLIDRASIKGLSKPANIFSLVTFEHNTTVTTGSFEQTQLGAMPGLTLVHGPQEVRFSPRLRRLDIGRLPDRDMVITGEHVSRNHASISVSGDTFTITDHSTNGTFVLTSSLELIKLRRTSTPLLAQGRIGLGRPPTDDYEAVIDFKIEDLRGEWR